MKFKSNLLGFLLCAGISIISNAQTASKTDVNKDIDVTRVYEQVVREGYGTPFIYEKLATAYYFKNEYNKAVIWFEKLFEDGIQLTEENSRRYKQAKKAVAATKTEKALVKI
ncbi:hypothetical protein [Aequorivita echinoideorum]|uniref:Tetratricopeptide repeat-containing protein n=1 Tax=Aequorivita echinoideorum TaxID=1549647 RepID=A0ABS5S0Z1_9FLAO|nr:hypothetical protein [Aequorivita echinoideorum]MBT0606877.1 hypothetical protein [Aequorivita echinoideorum]